MTKHLLHLTAAEQKLFQALPAKLRGGWEVDEEVSMVEERSEELVMRMRMANFTSAAAQKLAEQARGARNADELEKFVRSFDIVELPQTELMEFFFVLGTRGLSRMMRILLGQAKTDEDLEGIMTLTEIRRALSEANVIAV